VCAVRRGGGRQEASEAERILGVRSAPPSLGAHSRRPGPADSLRTRHWRIRARSACSGAGAEDIWGNRRCSAFGLPWRSKVRERSWWRTCNMTSSTTSTSRTTRSSRCSPSCADSACTSSTSSRFFPSCPPAQTAAPIRLHTD
jgi:hypothetical protein